MTNYADDIAGYRMDAMSEDERVSNYADYVDALSAQDHEPQTELARARIALAEAHRLNLELIDVIRDLLELDSPFSPLDASAVVEKAHAVLEKVKP